MMALVVAMAGMMLPAYSGERGQRGAGGKGVMTNL